MAIKDSQRYGGSARQAEDSRRWHRFCSSIGFLHIRHENGCVILSCQRGRDEALRQQEEE